MTWYDNHQASNHTVSLGCDIFHTFCTCNHLRHIGASQSLQGPESQKLCSSSPASTALQLHVPCARAGSLTYRPAANSAWALSSSAARLSVRAQKHLSVHPHFSSRARFGFGSSLTDSFSAGRPEDALLRGSSSNWRLFLSLNSFRSLTTSSFVGVTIKYSSWCPHNTLNVRTLALPFVLCVCLPLSASVHALYDDPIAVGLL